MGRIVSFVHSEFHARSPGNVHTRSSDPIWKCQEGGLGGRWNISFVHREGLLRKVHKIKRFCTSPQSRDSWLRFRTTRTEEIVPLARKNGFRNR